MSYVVEQKIRGKIYLYKVESYWDKTKKQSRQKRTYIGPKPDGKKQKRKQKRSNLVSTNFGNIFLLNFLANEVGLKKLLGYVFPKNYREILALAYYQIMENSAMYLFPYWLEEQNLEKVKKLNSSNISQLCEDLGRDQEARQEFIKKWIDHLKPIKAAYYDITSISSYATGIDFIEWGYNRDKERLPQLNMGVTFCRDHLLPIHYNLYPGSIVDVTTLKNCLKYLEAFELKDITLVLDRGFFSKKNILEMDNSKINFIQPLSYSLKKVKLLIKKNKKELSNPATAFKYNEEILNYMAADIEFDDKKFNAHLFFSEKAEVDQKHHFLATLLEFEENVINQEFKTLKEYLDYKKNNIPEKFRTYFKWNKTTFKIEKNSRTIKAYLSKVGSFILVTNKQLNKIDILDSYRQRDKVEKVFDVFKNEIDGDRIRAHSQYNTDGRLFLKFITLILYAKISSVMKTKNLFKKYSIIELLNILKNLKITTLDKQKTFLSELSKKQRNIFKAFGIAEDAFPRY